MDHLKHLTHALLAPRAVPAKIFQSKGNVLFQRHVREQRIGLEHRVHPALVRRQVYDIASVQPDRALAWRLEPG
jgi:hypothetical protein